MVRSMKCDVGMDQESMVSIRSPGDAWRLFNTIVFSLAGVPAKMMQMYVAVVEPRIVQEMGVGVKRWYFHRLKVFGSGESDTKCTTVSLGAHPEVLYYRLAKAGLNFLRLELLQHG